MNCPSDGTLRTFVDGEVAGGEMDAAGQHVASCEACRLRLQSLRESARRIEAKLNTTEPDIQAIDPALAYSRYRETQEGRTSSAGRLNWFIPQWIRPVIGGVAVALALVLVLSFSSSRTWAQKILEMLRVQKIAVVPVDLSAVSAQGGNGHEESISQFLSDNVVVTMKPGTPVAASGIAEAGQMAGFNVRGLDSLGAPVKVGVSGEGAFQITLNRDRIEAVLDQVGRSDVQIPDSVDGALVAVHVPKMVQMSYGQCDSKTAGAATSQSCIHFTQVPTPTISVPSGLNLSVLAEAGLQVTGMSATEAHSFAQTVDWSSTLVIPVPMGKSSYRSVTVDGVNGTLIETPHGNSLERFELIWLKNGIVYSIDGRGTPDQAVAAASLMG
jgi:hypothetical protein